MLFSQPLSISLFDGLDGCCHIRVQLTHLRIIDRTADHPQEACIAGTDQHTHGIAFFRSIHKCVKLIDLCREDHNTRNLLLLKILFSFSAFLLIYARY